MTDAIAQIEQHIQALKERDGVKTLYIQHFGEGALGAPCTVTLWDDRNRSSASAKNFNLAYTKALKRLKEKSK